MRRALRDKTIWLQRVSAALLLVFFSAFFLLPLLSGDGASEASLPACCRAHGKHRCLMSMGTLRVGHESNAPSFVRLSEKCPCRLASPVTVHGDTYHPLLSAFLFGELLAHPAVHAQTEAKGRIAFDRCRQKRGPPTPTPLRLGKDKSLHA